MHLKLFRNVVFLALLAATTTSFADTTEDWHTWGAVVATGKLGADDSDWRYWLEGQGRFNDDTSRFNQGILRTALGRSVGERATLWGGYAWIPTDRPAPAIDLSEHRVWQQLIWSPASQIAGFSFSSRTRLEQRNLENFDDVGVRFREFMKLTRPLGGSSRWYLSLWDEIFLNFNDTDWGADAGLDQNRLFAGLGLRLTPQAKAEVGYLNQYVERDGRPDGMNHILSFTLLLSF